MNLPIKNTVVYTSYNLMEDYPIHIDIPARLKFFYYHILVPPSEYHKRDLWLDNGKGITTDPNQWFPINPSRINTKSIVNSIVLFPSLYKGISKFTIYSFKVVGCEAPQRIKLK